MGLTAWMITLLIVHFIIAAVVILLALLRIVKIHVCVYPMVLLVPYFGTLAALVFDFYKRLRPESAEIEVDKFEVEDEIYKSLGFKPDDREDVVSLEEAMILNTSGTRRSLMMDLIKENVVPLEEALTISTSDVRRKLMMDVLKSDTVAFYELLEQARLNDDVEVVHYATTAMSELGKQYDALLATYGKKYENNPDDIDNLRRYCDCMQRYLDLGLVRGALERRRRDEYIELLNNMIRLSADKDDFVCLAKQQMLTENWSDADKTVCDMEDRWPQEQETWLIRLEYFARKCDGAGLRTHINNIYHTNIYFDSAARQQIDFWSDRAKEVKHEE